MRSTPREQDAVATAIATGGPALTPDLLEVPGAVTDGVLVTDIPGSPIVDIAAAGNQILALRADRTLHAWGGNGSGETDVPTPSPTRITAPD